MRSFLSLLLLFLPIAAFAGNGSGNVSNVFGLGQTQALLDGPAITGSDPSKWYTVICGFGASNVTSGRYYRCYKQGGASVAWTVSSTKVAYCPAYEIQTNGPAAMIFGYGTTQVTNDNASAPTGDVPYAPTGVSDYHTPITNGVPLMRRRMIYFSGVAAGATIYPYLQSQSSAIFMNVIFSCTEL